MREYDGEPKREPIILDDDAEFDPSDLDAAETVKRDAQLHEANCAAHQVARTVLAYRKAKGPDVAFVWLDVIESLEIYEQAMRGVVSGSTEEE